VADFRVRLRDVVLLLTQLLPVCTALNACPVQVSDAGTFYTAATTTSGEVRCPIPVFPLDSNSTLQLYSWTMYLSVDNSTWSNGTQLFVYDALNVTCNETAMTCAPSEVNQSQSVAVVAFRHIDPYCLVFSDRKAVCDSGLRLQAAALRCVNSYANLFTYCSGRVKQ